MISLARRCVRSVCNPCLRGATIVGLSLGGVAAAQTTAQIPYEGVLQVVDDGGPRLAHGPISVRFTLWSRADDGELVAAWTEEWSDRESRDCAVVPDCRVSTHDGFFSVALGSLRSGLLDVVRDADDVHIGISMWTGAEWTTLEGLQTLNTVPYALESEGASDLLVAGDLTGSGEVNGTLSATDLVVETETVAGGRVSAQTVSSVGFAEVGSASVGDANIAGALYVGGPGLTIDIGGTPRVMVERRGNALHIGDGELDSLQFGGSVTLTGEASCDGDCGGRLSNGGYSTPRDGGLLLTGFYSWGTSSGINTGISSDAWNCWVAGWNFVGGNPVNNDDYRFVVRAVPFLGTWRLTADIESESDHETHEVGVVCVSTLWSDS